MWETYVRSLGGEDSLKREIAAHSSTFAWKIFYEDPLPWGCKELDMTDPLSFTNE